MTPFVRQEIALSSLEREVAGGRAAAAEADNLHKEIDRLSGSAGFIDSEREKAGRPLVVLAAATRILPDDTYLDRDGAASAQINAERQICRGRPPDRSPRRRWRVSKSRFFGPGDPARGAPDGTLHDQRGDCAVASLAAMPTGRKGRLLALGLLLIALAAFISWSCRLCSTSMRSAQRRSRTAECCFLDCTPRRMSSPTCAPVSSCAPAPGPES